MKQEEIYKAMRARFATVLDGFVGQRLEPRTVRQIKQTLQATLSRMIDEGLINFPVPNWQLRVYENEGSLEIVFGDPDENLPKKGTEMFLDEYQDKAKVTAFYPRRWANLNYPTLGLCGEAGEFANKVKKIERDHGGVLTDAVRQALKEELGDVLWYVAMCADELGLTLSDVAETNVAKLASRLARDQIKGEGDQR
jgi:NTP pyrophosphatase (non-canonical NTP hydrolase)